MSLNPKLFFESAKKARNFGEGVFGVSIVLSVGSFVALYFTGGMPLGWGKAALIVLGLGGTCSFLPGAIIASDYKNRDYWKDPAFRDERRKSIIETFIYIGEEGARTLHQCTWEKHKLFTERDVQIITDALPKD